jgi:mannan endo-1,4-beta-mannosidase
LIAGVRPNPEDYLLSFSLNAPMMNGDRGESTGVGAVRGVAMARAGRPLSGARRGPTIRAALAVLILPTLVASLWSPAATAKVRVPSLGIWLGAFPNKVGDNVRSLRQIEATVGRQMKIVNKYHPWSSHNYRFERQLIARGRIPLISWRATEQSPDGSRAQKIASGQYDGVIRRAATAIRALRGRVLIRFAWEMDQGPGERQYIGKPIQFVRAWRRVVSIFRARGATNAEFIWAPRAGSFKKGIGQRFYPGAAWVDWIGGSAVPIHNYATFRNLFGGFYSWASRQPKPLLIWNGVRERGGNAGWKATYFRGMNGAIRGWRRVKAVVYYHARAPKGYAYYVDTSPQALRAFRGMVRSNYFTPGPGNALL